MSGEYNSVDVSVCNSLDTASRPTDLRAVQVPVPLGPLSELMRSDRVSRRINFLAVVPVGPPVGHVDATNVEHRRHHLASLVEV